MRISLLPRLPSPMTRPDSQITRLGAPLMLKGPDDAVRTRMLTRKRILHMRKVRMITRHIALNMHPVNLNMHHVDLHINQVDLNMRQGAMNMRQD